jgi:hypothetical protein
MPAAGNFYLFKLIGDNMVTRAGDLADGRGAFFISS